MNPRSAAPRLLSAAPRRGAAVNPVTHRRALLGRGVRRVPPASCTPTGLASPCRAARQAGSGPPRAPARPPATARRRGRTRGSEERFPRNRPSARELSLHVGAAPQARPAASPPLPLPRGGLAQACSCGQRSSPARGGDHQAGLPPQSQAGGSIGGAFARK